jgi:hypothetical protein
VSRAQPSIADDRWRLVHNQAIDWAGEGPAGAAWNVRERAMKTAMRLLIFLSVLVAIARPATAGLDAKQVFEQQSRQSGGGM